MDQADHENPLDVSDVGDDERGRLLEHYLALFVNEFGEAPKLMPLGSNKRPIIEGRARLDTPKGRSYLVDPEEAVRQIKEDGADGFALYAGKEEHNTEDVVFVDHDDLEEFPTPTGEPTLKVLSGSGRGYHETYRNAGDVDNSRVGDNWGEIRAENLYVILPGSVHPSGGIYHVDEPRPVATLADDDLDEHMRPNTPNRPTPREGEPAEDAPGEGSMPSGEEIQRRLERAFGNNHDGERIRKVYDGDFAAAGFQDRSSAEFWLACRIDSFVGFGDPRVVERVLDSANLQKWPDRGRSYKQSTLSKVGHQDWYADETNTTADVGEERSNYPSIDDVEFPTCNFVLDKPPREGGSYAMIRDFLDRHDHFFLLAPRHQILKYHLETVCDEMIGGNVVHLEGRHRVCEHASDDVCPKNPGTDMQARGRFETEVKDIMHRKKKITADECPEHICPAWFLKKAAETANVVLTVPQLFVNVDRDFSEMRLMIDEEQSLDYFEAGSVDVMEIGRTVENDGTKSVQQMSSNIKDQMGTLEEIRQRIYDDQEERAEEAAEEGRGWQPTGREKAVLAAIEAVEEVKEATGISDTIGEIDGDVTVGAVADEIQRRLDRIETPNPDLDPDRLKQSIFEYSAPYFWNDDVEPSTVLEAVCFPAADFQFHFKQTGGSYKLRMIGDKERNPFHREELNEFKQIGVIAGPQGQRFLDKLDGDFETIKINRFKYADDFVVVPVGRERDGELEYVSRQRSRVKRAAKKLNASDVPQISIAGTKSQARDLADSFSEGGADVITEPTSPAKALSKLWSTGSTAVIYENSIVSRGIDAPFFDITCITSPGFATPYWEAKKDHYRGEDVEEYQTALAVESELKSRELTNAALRMAPTYDSEEVMGTKFIVVSASDANRLKYLYDRKLARQPTATDVIDALEKLVTGGGLEIKMDQVYRKLDRSEKWFIDVSLVEEFTEVIRYRASYDLDELERWIEDGVLGRDGALREVMSALDEEGVKTTEVHKRVTPIKNGKVDILLDILVRKGIVGKEVVENHSHGGAETVYFLM